MNKKCKSLSILMAFTIVFTTIMPTISMASEVSNHDKEELVENSDIILLRGLGMDQPGPEFTTSDYYTAKELSQMVNKMAGTSNRDAILNGIISVGGLKNPILGSIGVVMFISTLAAREYKDAVIEANNQVRKNDYQGATLSTTYTWNERTKLYNSGRIKIKYKK